MSRARCVHSRCGGERPVHGGEVADDEAREGGREEAERRPEPAGRAARRSEALREALAARQVEAAGGGADGAFAASGRRDPQQRSLAVELLDRQHRTEGVAESGAAGKDQAEHNGQGGHRGDRDEQRGAVLVEQEAPCRDEDRQQHDADQPSALQHAPRRHPPIGSHPGERVQGRERTDVPPDHRIDEEHQGQQRNDHVPEDMERECGTHRQPEEQDGREGQADQGGASPQRAVGGVCREGAGSHGIASLPQGLVYRLG